jgi:hypothetical protein
VELVDLQLLLLVEIQEQTELLILAVVRVEDQQVHQVYLFHLLVQLVVQE